MKRKKSVERYEAKAEVSACRNSPAKVIII